MALIGFLSTVALAGQGPFVLRYKPGDRYTLEVKELRVTDFTKESGREPRRVIGTWQVRTVLTFKQKDGARAVTAREAELEAQWNDGPAPKGFLHRQRNFYKVFELVIPLKPDRTAVLPPGLEKGHSTKAAIAECLLPVLSRDPVAPGSVWKLTPPDMPGVTPSLTIAKASVGVYERDIAYNKAIRGQFAPTRHDVNLAMLSYSAADRVRVENLLIYYSKAQNVVIRGICRRWRFPGHPDFIRHQSHQASYTLTRIDERALPRKERPGADK